VARASVAIPFGFAPTAITLVERIDQLTAYWIYGSGLAAIGVTAVSMKGHQGKRAKDEATDTKRR
jgi:hypothetical protein